MPANDHIASDIRYLSRHEIDTGRWDDCIMNAAGSLIYGQSWYLDQMAGGQWDALILGDYVAVMPLTWRSRAGIRYCYQPAFTQQTGIFAAHIATEDIVAAFLRQLDRHFRFAEIFLNYTNSLPSLEKRTNFILPLAPPYAQLAARYKKDLIRNLKAAGHSSLHYLSDYNWRTALLDFRSEYSSRLPGIKEKDYRHFDALCAGLHGRGQLITRAVVDDHGRALCSAVLLKDTRRFYLLHSTTRPAGRNAEANHFLLDNFIREWSGTPMILDFEGSDHPGIAHFYANFGAIDQPYFFYRHNHLPWPIRRLK